MLECSRDCYFNVNGECKYLELERGEELQQCILTQKEFIELNNQK